MARIVAKRKNLVSIIEQMLEFMRTHKTRTARFDHTFSGSDDTVALPAGWKPLDAFLNGSLQQVGSGNDVTFKRDGDVWVVVWSTAPSNTDWARIWAEST